MSILNKIIQTKREEVKQLKLKFPLELLKQEEFYKLKPLSLYKSLKGKGNIIAEFKRQSPSKGIINTQVEIKKTVSDYAQSGAAALSVLTDRTFFGGTNKDILKVRNMVNVPILRKDFVVDGYQIHEAKAIGADAILLIASCLSDAQIEDYTLQAKELGLDVLLELHTEDEIKSITPFNNIIGINNRNLKTFQVSLDHSLHLYNLLPKDRIIVAESGIKSAEDAERLCKYGFNALLIGEYFMKDNNPAEKLKSLHKKLKSLHYE